MRQTQIASLQPIAITSRVAPRVYTVDRGNENRGIDCRPRLTPFITAVPSLGTNHSKSKSVRPHHGTEVLKGRQALMTLWGLQSGKLTEKCDDF